MNKATHPYHLVDPSPWPLLIALSLGLMALGGIFYMHGIASWVLILGVLFVLAMMFVWFRDVILESGQNHHTPSVQVGLRFGMAFFIASEIMFFVAFFWAFFDASLGAENAQQYLRLEHTGGMWPPKGVVPFDAFDVPFLNTLVLLLSGSTITWAHYSLLQGDRKGMLQGLGYTVLLGLFFTSLQAYEYVHAAFGFQDGIYSTTFYMATGFHGFHVLVGTSFLIVCFFRARAGHFQPNHCVGFDSAAWYWHFVDVVWLFLFVSIYWWGGR